MLAEIVVHAAWVEAIVIGVLLSVLAVLTRYMFKKGKDDVTDWLIHIAAQAENTSRKTDEVSHKTSSNGLDSNNVGDVAKRVENTMNDLVIPLLRSVDSRLLTVDSRVAKLSVRVNDLETEREQRDGD